MLLMKETKGVGLLEVLVAMTILSIGIIGAMQLFPMAMRNVQTANERTVITNMASSRLQELQSAGGENLLLRRLEQGGRARSVPALATAGHLNQSSEIYGLYTSSVQRMRGASQVYLQRVTMNVQTSDGRYEQYVTYVTRR